MIEVTDKVRRESFMIIESEPEFEKRKGLKGDYANVTLLIFLYILQGIPLGIIVTIPMIMASNNVSYSSQAIFSLARYPYVLKLIWAPIVDSVYSKRFGRRKTWLVPSQYCLALSMFLMSVFANEFIGDKNNPPKIYLLTASMFLIIFFTATQDVAVDAWAISLLSRRNVHYASPCNAVGVIFGRFASNTLFLSLESPAFCNKWLRSVPKDTGMVTLKDFFVAAGVIFALTTTFICFFKKEKNAIGDDEERVKGVCSTYKVLLKILQLKSIQLLAFVQLTQFVGHAVVAFVTDLKLIQFGIRRENLSLLQAPIAIFNLVLPFILVTKAKNNPLMFFWKSSLFKLLTGFLVVGVVYWTQTFYKPKEFPNYYYVILFAVLFIYDISKYAMSMSIWAFKTRIADPSVGATYMTLLTMLSQVGAKWTGTLALWVIDSMAVKVNLPKFIAKHRLPEDNELKFNSSDLTGNHTHHNTFKDENAKMPVDPNEFVIDGYFTEFLVCTILGVIWLIGFKPVLKRMQNWPESKWRHKKLFRNQPETKF